MRLIFDRKMRPMPSRLLSRANLETLQFPHEVALWKPSKMETLKNGSVYDGTLLADVGFELATKKQSCFYNATPETNEATVLGRTRVNNLFTLDVFLFPEGAILGDGWVLYLLTPGDNQHRLYVCQGSPQSVQPGPLHSMGGQRALVARVQVHPSNLPPGIDLEALS